MPKGMHQPPKMATAANSQPTHMPLNLGYPGLRKVHEKPPVFLVDDFLTSDECDHLVKSAGPLLQRSKTHAIAGSGSIYIAIGLNSYLRLLSPSSNEQLQLCT